MSSDQTYWERYDIHGKVVDVLRSRPGEFLTAYQLAIELEHAFERGVDYPSHWVVGGEGLGNQNSLTQYLALWLSRKIGNGEITDIELARLSHLHISDLAFSNRSEKIGATTLSSESNQTIYRLR